jgi:hypothetical protein
MVTKSFIHSYYKYKSIQYKTVVQKPHVLQFFISDGFPKTYYGYSNMEITTVTSYPLRWKDFYLQRHPAHSETENNGNYGNYKRERETFLEYELVNV